MDRDEKDRLERLIADKVTGHIPDGEVQRVMLLQYGDEPVIEPGELLVRVFVTPPTDGSEDRDPIQQFEDAHRRQMKKLRSDLSEELPGVKRLEFACDIGDEHFIRVMVRPGPTLGESVRADGELTPVMARLGPADLDTLDALITAGIATSRADAVRWALARIRERPAYGELRERAREIERLKTEF